MLPIARSSASWRAKRRRKGKAFGGTPAVRAMVLYPMNALVNDQLGRLRLLFGDPRIVGRFMKWSGRPARFARYTSRTLYPGVRDEDKDKERLTAHREVLRGQSRNGGRRRQALSKLRRRSSSTS